MNLLIKNVRVIDAFQDFTGEIYIENGIIKEIAKEINKSEVEVLDGKGKVLMPSFIDTHAHFREPGLTHKEDLETGSKAAVKGGYTGVCLMANTSPVCSTKEVVDKVINRGKEIGLVDLIQSVSITKNFDGKTTDHLEGFFNNSDIRTISDDGVGVMNSAVMLKAMNIAKDNGWVVMSHAEDSTFSSVDMRIAENLMTIRDIYLAKETGAWLHMAHVSIKEAIESIKKAKYEGVKVTCEVTPHHIALTNDKCNYRVNPPIREKEDVNSIITAIKNGVVDCIGTDHAPHTKEDKEKGSPGMVGLETAFSICHTVLCKENGVTLNKLSEIMSNNPAKVLGLNKGTITLGKSGDVVLVDLDKKVTVNSSSFVSKGKNTPFEGFEYYGEVLLTIKAGEIVYKGI